MGRIGPKDAAGEEQDAFVFGEALERVIGRAEVLYADAGTLRPAPGDARARLLTSADRLSDQAAALGERCRVVAVDVAGRGHSDWLADPTANPARIAPPTETGRPAR